MSLNPSTNLPMRTTSQQPLDSLGSNGMQVALDESDRTPPVLLLTIEEAAERLHIGRCTMQALLTSGEVQSLKIGRLRRVPPSALKDYIERRMAL